MKIATDTVATFHYRLTDEQGQLIESSENHHPTAALIGRRNILPALDDAMLGKAVNETFSVTLSPEQAYGRRTARPVQRIPVKHLRTRGKLSVGQPVVINTEQGDRSVTVVKVGKFSVDVDTNHPLAGKTITFEITVTDVREATWEEKSHGHAHGVGGHDH